MVADIVTKEIANMVSAGKGEPSRVTAAGTSKLGFVGVAHAGTAAAADPSSLRHKTCTGMSREPRRGTAASRKLGRGTTRRLRAQLDDEPAAFETHGDRTSQTWSKIGVSGPLR